MARYEQNYAGERRSYLLGIKLTPTEKRTFKAAADAKDVPLSTYVRDYCLKRSRKHEAPRRNPEFKALLHELSAIGNNLNQLARHANTSHEMPSRMALAGALDKLKEAMGHVLDL
jgi:mobilization protein NikA